MAGTKTERPTIIGCVESERPWQLSGKRNVSIKSLLPELGDSARSFTSMFRLLLQGSMEFLSVWTSGSLTLVPSFDSFPSVALLYPTSTWQFLSYRIIFCYSLLLYPRSLFFLRRDRKETDQKGGRGCGKELGGAEGGEPCLSFTRCYSRGLVTESFVAPKKLF